ncbi:YqgE/AlgH family protein [Planctomicrobium sp.]|nr:YqgE/AlgH family protein [Planctomicrobium sp.]MDA7503461.1 YqgE/AlgH family protein [bacterium]MDB4743422.1 YqgE/AlgH family protein [Planctomicrobium sp.]
MSHSLRGKFLIAGTKLRDSTFFKSVILIVEHGPDGAMGLIVNQPSSNTVSYALQEHMSLPENQELVYVGGPVEPENLFVVHNSADLDPTEMPVVEDVFMGSSSEVFVDILQASIDEPDGLAYRVYMGCSGWGPDQLEGELERGDWLTVDAAAETVFHKDPYQIWNELIGKTYQTKRLFPIECDHPEWN